MPLVQKSVKSLGFEPVDERLIAEDIQQIIEAVNELEGGGGSEYTETIVNISSAQILALNSGNEIVLPDLEVGKYYDWHMFIEYNYNTTPFAAGNLLEVSYNGNFDSIKIIPIDLFEGGLFYISPEYYARDNSQYLLNYAKLIPLNKGLIITKSQLSSTLADGNGTLRVKIYHKTITFGA
jgi:hypothetical protein